MLTKNTKQETTVRFAHVDAAGIIFYARYFEMIGRLFPGSPLASAPVAFQMQIFRPNRLGDRISISHEMEENSGAWSFSGQCNGDEHFLIRSLTDDKKAPSKKAHLEYPGALRIDVGTVGAWSAGSDGRLQLPRYFEHISNAVESWFSEILNLPVFAMLSESKLAIPTVRFTTRCHELPRLGDDVDLWICPQHIGGKSLKLISCLVRDDVILAETEQVLVFVKMTDTGYESIAIPEPIRSLINEQLAANGT